jgi:hypothetical protein
VAVGSDSFVPTRLKSDQQKQLSELSKNSSGSGYIPQNLSKAKAISSAQVFGEDKAREMDSETKARLSQLSGQKAISSASLFERDEGGIRKTFCDFDLRLQRRWK